MAIFWAVVCMVLAACNDLLFKFYARRKRSHGRFLAIIGVTWFVTACCFLRGRPEDWRATLLWGAISGFFSVGGNLLMLDAMRVLDAGVCSTIYRLNLVPVVVGAALLLGESISPAGYAGIGCALLAVIGFIPRGGEAGLRRAAVAGFAAMVLASLMRAGMGLSYRYGFLHGAEQAWVVVINSLFWVFGGLLYAFWRESGDESDDPAARRKLWGYGLLSGVLVAGIVLTMAASLYEGKASVVLPIEQMSFVLTGVLGVLLLKEKMGPLKIAAVLCGAAAVLLLSR